MLKKLIVVACVLTHAQLMAQTEISAFTATGTGAVTTFVTDYQALGINPANLGWDAQFEGKRFTIGALDFGFSIHSEALSDPKFRNLFSADAATQSLEEKRDVLNTLVNNGFYMSLDVNWLGFGVTTQTLGGFAFSVRDRLQTNIEFTKTGGELLMLGYNAPYFDQKFDENDNPTNNPDEIAYGVASNPQTLAQLFEGTQLLFNWYREFNLGYGKRLINNDILSLYGGVGVKYLQGLGVMDISADGEEFTAFSAFNPEFNDVPLGSSFSNLGFSNFSNQTVGDGFGVDIGVNAVIAKKLKVGMALNGLGRINWEGDAQRAVNETLDTTYFGGLLTANILEEMVVLLSDSGLFQWEKVEEGAKTIATPAVWRLGASFHPGKKFQIGGDLTLPVNGDVPGSLSGAIYGFGASVKPLPWFRFSAGYLKGENISSQYPVGITFIKGLGIWESGIASRDIVSLFVDNGSTISLVTGFLRFRF